MASFEILKEIFCRILRFFQMSIRFLLLFLIFLSSCYSWINNIILIKLFNVVFLDPFAFVRVMVSRDLVLFCLLCVVQLDKLFVQDHNAIIFLYHLRIRLFLGIWEYLGKDPLKIKSIGVFFLENTVKEVFAHLFIISKKSISGVLVFSWTEEFFHSFCSFSSKTINTKPKSSDELLWNYLD